MIGKDGKTVILKYGAYLVRAHETRVVHAPYDFSKDASDQRNEKLRTCVEKDKNETEAKPDSEETVESESEPTSDKETDHNRAIKMNSDIPKIGQRVRIKLKGSNEWKQAVIQSRAGKASGQFCDWRNLIFDDGTSSAIDWNKDVDNFSIIEEVNQIETNKSEIMGIKDKTKMHNVEVSDQEKEAKLKELENWKMFDVYDEVCDEGLKAVSVRWVLTEKTMEDGGKKMKARLVARGFEEHEEIQTDSPTVAKEMMRTYMAIAASKGWNINSIDIKAAFLQSEEISREVFIKAPKEANCGDGILWRLKKCVYGLTDAARNWFLTMKTFLLQLGCIQVKTNPSAFYWLYVGNLEGVFVMHVDDFLWGGTKRFENLIIMKINEKFNVGQQSQNIFKYIGLEVTENNNGIIIDQNQYGK